MAKPRVRVGGVLPRFRKLNIYGKLALIFVCLMLFSGLMKWMPLFGQVTGKLKPWPQYRPYGRANIQMPIPPFKYRADLGHILEAEGMRTGVELGVQRGKYSHIILSRWKSCASYVLVDLWKHQANYKDLANFNNAVHDKLRRETLERLYSALNTTFDFIYVDARHDYKGVLQDLNDWYPMLKPGGIIAGHDYVTNNDGPRQQGQDWSVNFDGTKDPAGRAVKGAVDDFAAKHGLHISVSYREGGWNTWAARKPSRSNTLYRMS